MTADLCKAYFLMLIFFFFNFTLFGDVKCSPLLFPGFLTDAFLCVAELLTFADLISILMGQHQPIARLRRPMRQFVSERVMNGSGVTDENVQRATEQVVQEMLPDLRAFVVRGRLADTGFVQSP